MRIPRALLLVSVVAAFAVSGRASANRIHRQTSNIAISGTNDTVRFVLYKGYFTVVQGTAGPLKNLNFFLDTGTRPPILDVRVAKKLHLQGREPVRIAIVGGRAQGERANLPWLEIGPVHQTNLPIVITDLSFFRKLVPVRIDGIVGLDELGQKPFVIDYNARVIRFGEAPALPVSVPLRLDRGLAVFDAEVNHTAVHLLLDTGASSLILFTKTLPLSSRADALLDTDDIGKFDSRLVWLRIFRLGSVEFRKEPALLTLNPRPSQFDFDGLISPPALGISRVAVNVEAGTLGFSR